ncbi:myosin-2 [Brassica rapa]|uniref:myosin-2 n=1 Tax=Brassica campestris TaxID=3711 RepID=UPI00142D5C89|nr:myosin-2 [Brassica rapa]
MDSHRTHTNPSTLLVTSAAELLPSTTVTSLRELLPSVSALLSAQETLSLVSGCKWAVGTGEDTVYFFCLLTSVVLLLSKAVKVFTEELVPANPDILEGVAELIQLSYLN